VQDSQTQSWSPNLGSVPGSSPVVSAAESESLTPQPSPTASATPLQIGTIVTVTASDIGLRTVPSAPAATSVALELGEELYVVDQVVETNGERWYLVGSVFQLWGPDAAGLRSLGWIGPETEVRARLRERTLDCPENPTSADSLQALRPLERLACFGADALEVTGVVPPPYPCCGPSPDYVIEPYWLSTLFGPYLSGLTLHAAPDTILDDLVPGDSVRATGQLDSPLATGCVAKSFPAGENQVELPELRAWAVLWCRTQFVVTRMEITRPSD
jgi:hypothetical protein